jgi:hypothetical protein
MVLMHLFKNETFEMNLIFFSRQLVSHCARSESVSVAH